MRAIVVNLVAMALLLVGTSTASAMEFYATLNPAGEDLVDCLLYSDQVILDIYLDADPGLELFSVALVWEDDGILAYQPGASSMPSYILYTGGKGATYLVPQVDPPAYWNGVNLPGKKQLNIEYWGTDDPAAASGTGIWLATIVFHVTGSGDGKNNIDLTLDAPGTIVLADGIVADQTTTSGHFFVQTIPEPTTAVLIGFGLLGFAVTGQRR